MADEAKNIRDAGFSRYQADGTVTPYEVRQGPTGLCEVYDNATAKVSGDYPVYRTSGTYTIQKTSGVVILKGGRVYWDHSANTATYKKVHDRDFYMGRAAEDAASTGPTVAVVLNEDPPYDLDMMRDPCDSTAVGTQALGGFLPPYRKGGAIHFVMSATNEAQKLNLLTVDGFAGGANAIVEFAFRVISDGAGTVVDVSLGVANADHATDADSITESVFCHLDANNTNINFESDDGTTEVAATDSTTDYTEGSAASVREEIWMDFRNPADVQIYRNAVLMLDGTTFNVNAATGPWKLLAHIEKTASTDTYELALDWMRARYAEQ